MLHFKALRRVIVLMLVAVMLCGMMAVSASAAGNVMRKPDNLGLYIEQFRKYFDFWDQHGIARKWVHAVEFHDTLADVPENHLDFSETWGDHDVLAWYENNTLHVAADGKVVLNPDSSWMFESFVNVKTIHFNNAVDTSKVEKMDNMFSHCWNLEEVDLECFDTSNVKTMDHMFFECRKLKTVDVSGFDTSKVTNMMSMFYGCFDLEKVDVSGFDTSNVGYMNHMFAYCRSLKDFDVSHFDTSKVVDFDHMFFQCMAMGDPGVSNFNTSNVKNMNSMFTYCVCLEKLDLSKWDVSNVKDMANMFSNTWLLKDLNLSGWDVSNVKNYSSFMSGSAEIDGRPWWEFFTVKK